MDAVSATGNTPAERPAPTCSSEGTRGPVVVGVDGSPAARAALATGLGEAARRGAALDVVAACPVPLVWTGGVPFEVPDEEARRVDTDRRARDLIGEVQQEAAGAGVPGVEAVPVRVIVVGGRPVPVLLEAAEEAQLLVLGNRGRGAMRSAVLGSVALHCVSSAPCPVIVVHAGATGSQPSRVVVGVDGSAGARAAVAAAVRSGAEVEVEVVTSYALADHWTNLTTVVLPTAEQIRDELLHRTEDLVDGVLAERVDGSAAPTIRIHVVGGAAGDVLVERARGAELLVVGSRGRGAIPGLLLGSVALHCAMHAPGAVMVVHPARTRSAVEMAPFEPALARG